MFASSEHDQDGDIVFVLKPGIHRRYLENFSRPSQMFFPFCGRRAVFFSASRYD